jgi:hypothetical protein
MIRSKLINLRSTILKWKTLKQVSNDSYALKNATELVFEDYYQMAINSWFPNKIFIRDGYIRSFINGVQQLITPLEDREKILLKYSSLLFNPHEVFQLKVLDQWGHEHYSKVRHGNTSSFGTSEYINNEIIKFEQQLRRNKIQITNMDILHTHPSVDMKIITSHKTAIIQNGLSISDIKLYQSIKNEYDFKINIKAILPNNISYSLSA